MANTSWSERRQRMVKCKIHGLHFDPELSTGCTRCLKAAASIQSRRPPQLVIILLCLLGMSFILFYIFGPNQGAARGPIDLGVASTLQPAATKLDPEPFRQELEDLEIALFRMPLEDTADLLEVGDSISSAAETLSGAILAVDPNDGLEAADQIARLGQSISPDQVAFADIQRVRVQWLRMRREQLQPAAWFLEPGDASVPTETTVADYSDVASSLRGLIEDGAAEADSLAAGTDVPAEEAEVRWQEFAREWRQQIDALASRLPSRPGASADSRLLAGIQDLEQALNRTRSLASGSQPPLGGAASTDFDEAISAALRAQQAFDGLLP